MSVSNLEVTTNEIMAFLQTNMVTRTEFNDRVGSLEIRFDNLEIRFDSFEERFDNLEERFDNLVGRVDSLDCRVGHIENQMVTKDYLDDKLADLGAEIGRKISRQTKRHEILVNILAEKDILQRADIERLEEVQ